MDLKCYFVPGRETCAKSQLRVEVSLTTDNLSFNFWVCIHILFQISLVNLKNRLICSAEYSSWFPLSIRQFPSSPLTSIGKDWRTLCVLKLSSCCLVCHLIPGPSNRNMKLWLWFHTCLWESIQGTWKEISNNPVITSLPSAHLRTGKRQALLVLEWWYFLSVQPWRERNPWREQLGRKLMEHH